MARISVLDRLTSEYESFRGKTVEETLLKFLEDGLGIQVEVVKK